MRVMNIQHHLAEATSNEVTPSAYRVLPSDIWHVIKPLQPEQNGRNFADDILKYIVFNKNVRISIES